MLRPGSSACQCAGCGAYFGGVYGFDLHRVGPLDGRRCADPSAVGLVRDGRGVWRQPAPRHLRIASASGPGRAEAAA